MQVRVLDKSAKIGYHLPHSALLLREIFFLQIRLCN